MDTANTSAQGQHGSSTARELQFGIESDGAITWAPVPRGIEGYVWAYEAQRRLRRVGIGAVIVSR